jgi:hypothetical protein
MALALLNLLFLPTVQLAFTALACTDTRESPAHLNLLPFVACDSAWRTAVLPAAVVTALVPFALLLRYPSNNDQRRQSDFAESLHAVLRSRTQGFQAHVAWWEGVQLLRRLALAVIVAFVPYTSAVSAACPACLTRLCGSLTAKLRLAFSVCDE